MRMILPLLALGFLLAAGTAAAQASDGSLGLSLTQGMYCDLKGLFSGKIGLLVGFVVALMGLMKIVQGSTGGGIVLIICGVLVTFLPSLVEGTLSGLGNVLHTTGISTRPPGPGIGC